MSQLREHSAGDQQSFQRPERLSASKAGALAAAALVLTAAGYGWGARTTSSAHHPQVVSGTAVRIPANVPVAHFYSDSGDRVMFRLDDVVWKAGEKTGGEYTVPPCLRVPGQKVDVEVGLIEVTRPYGSGSYLKVLSVNCGD